jgi:hypothetical protein
VFINSLRYSNVFCPIFCLSLVMANFTRDIFPLFQCYFLLCPPVTSCTSD